MSKSKKKAVERILINWRGIVDKANEEADLRKYAEAYFIGAWSVMSDQQAAFLLKELTSDEFRIIMDYPIWM